ncbi:Reticulocyte-binding protein [Paramyrothecium foliicola]|nr:Reticulocyte-binding protein [Paramyrothecium foliicola]
MEEIERLRKQLEEAQRLREEEQRLRQAAESRALEEQQQREEQQRLREEEQRLREEEQRLREEEQRLRKEAEDRAVASQPLPLYKYLETCHALSLAIEVVTDRSLTTQGDTTNPTGRIYPKRIVPWTNFAREQEKIWDQLSRSPKFSADATFPSQHQMDYVRSLLRPISSEIGLRNAERDVVENAVQKLMDACYNDALLRDCLGLDGTVTFESHTNLGATDDSLSESIEQVSISSRSSNQTRHRRKARGKGNRADQFCIYRTSDEQSIPAVAIEYKPPHKLSLDEITTGLVSEIQPDRDVINQEGEGFDFAARRLATAVVTQLYSYMIGKDIRHGYVDTGEVYVFLHIGDDPACVYYSTCVPSLDVQDDDETRLHRTAVAQVFAFVLQGIRSPPPPQTWHTATENLETWSVEYDDVLRSIPTSNRKPQRETPYKPSRWKGFVRSPIRTRSRCSPSEHTKQQPSSEDSDSDESPFFTPNFTISEGSNQNTATALKASETGSETGKSSSRAGSKERKNIKDRLYCSHKCLRGVAFGGPMDEKCPNAKQHGDKHINQVDFLRLIREQLAIDREADADCMPLYLSGARGSLFKIRLTSHGYTLVAKGVESMDVGPLNHENEMYGRLGDLQGEYIPVCLGLIDLIEPYYYDCGVYKHFMFLSYAGRPVIRELGTMTANVADHILNALNRLHKRGVLHHDAEPRNVLYDRCTGKCMIVDLMLAEVHERQPLGSINANSHNRKRKREFQKQARDVFATEAQSLLVKLCSNRGNVSNLYSHSQRVIG